MKFYKCARDHHWKCEGNCSKSLHGHTNEPCPTLLSKYQACGQQLKYMGTKKPVGPKMTDIKDIDTQAAKPLQPVQPVPQLTTVSEVKVELPKFKIEENIPTLEIHLPRHEAQSQSELTKIFAAKEIAFLNRSGKFGPYVPPTDKMNPDESVEEPGFSNGSPLLDKGYKQLGFLLGRLEVSAIIAKHGFDVAFYVHPNPLVRGGVTYPDFVLCFNETPFAIELKTPRTFDLKTFVDEQFYAEKRLRGIENQQVSRSVEEEIQNRAKHLPKGYVQVLAIDLRNLKVPQDVALGCLHDEVTDKKRKSFWKGFDGVLLILDEDTLPYYSRQQLKEYIGFSKQKTLFSYGEKETSKFSSGWTEVTVAKGFTLGPCGKCQKLRILETSSGICLHCLLGEPETTQLTVKIATCPKCSRQTLVGSSHGRCLHCLIGDSETPIVLGENLAKCTECMRISFRDPDNGLCTDCL